MTSGGCGGNAINRYEESREALKILGCNKIISLNFNDTKLYLQIKEMIDSLERILATEIPSDVEIMRVYTMRNPQTVIKIMSLFIRLRWLPVGIFLRF